MMGRLNLRLYQRGSVAPFQFGEIRSGGVRFDGSKIGSSCKRARG